MQTNVHQFLAIRWSILITLVVMSSRHNLAGNGGVVSALVSKGDQNGIADLLLRYEVRDRIGKRFALNAEAIDHSKRLAARFRSESGHDEPDLTICVVDESGREIHRELVHPMVPT